MSNGNDSESVVLHYFVDEAGDPTLFARRRQTIVGQEGCSKYFILGKLEVDDPQSLNRDLESLRAELLADPYFKSVPSMQPDEGKTAVMFHAKDDLPEVRREVFALLPGLRCKVQVIIRRKDTLAREAEALENRYHLPTGHPAAGAKAWLFVDELLVNPEARP